MSTIRYNLRARASGPRPGAHSGLAPPPDSEHSDAASVALSARSGSSIRRPGVSYSQVVSNQVGADTVSHSDREADPQDSGADTVPSNGREAYPRVHSSQAGTVEESPLSLSNKENITPRSVIEPSVNSTATNIASRDVVRTSQWTEVRHKKPRARSLDAALSRPDKVPPARLTPLSSEQRRVVYAAESMLSKDDRGRIKKRMRAISRPRERSSSQEGGPSAIDKGKMIDPRNWGSIGLSPREYDVRAQQKELDRLAAHRQRKEYYISDQDSEEEQQSRDAALQYHAAVKASKRRPKASVHTATDISDDSVTNHQSRVHENPRVQSSRHDKARGTLDGQTTARQSSGIQPTSREDLEKQVKALRKELNKVRRAQLTPDDHEEVLGTREHEHHRRRSGEQALLSVDDSSRSEAGTVRLNKSISDVLRKGSKATKNKSKAKGKTPKAKEKVAFADPSLGMATTIVEDALGQPSRQLRQLVSSKAASAQAPPGI
ncbi:hypothetical protein BD311DRAFT_809248 [Dichomitus squalens]|uniref:Uncharacterized protein n=1 Tax=Dichomitus squalens TaxID=114155 RepID=A0A4Q9MFQ4_9APHY|nr:hypothetical protein BD311DRAFT_809248 [Dichomitus squalens]